MSNVYPWVGWVRTPLATPVQSSGWNRGMFVDARYTAVLPKISR